MGSPDGLVVDSMGLGVVDVKTGTMEEALQFKITNTLQDIKDLNIKLIKSQRGVIPPNFYKKRKK